MIVVISSIRVTSGNADALASQYRRRMRRVEDVDGCLGVEILRHVDRPDEFMIYSRWRDDDAYRRYRRDPAFREAHERIADIPGGLRIDASTRAVDRYEIIS